MSSELQRQGTLTTGLSLAVNVVMAGAKLSVGLIAKSQALVADGIHSLVDIASDIAAIVGLRFSHLPKDDDHPYGHHRFSTLATMLISSLVLIFCLGLAWQSLSALVSGAETPPANPSPQAYSLSPNNPSPRLSVRASTLN
jgi:cation diffusion facilitator family transporter